MSRQSTKAKKGAGPQETGLFHPPKKLGVKNPPKKRGFLLLHFILQVQQAGHHQAALHRRLGPSSGELGGDSAPAIGRPLVGPECAPV